MYVEIVNAMPTNKLDSLKLRVAKPVEDIPEITKGSAINRLPEYQDAEAIIAAIKEGAEPHGRKWAIFDKQQAVERTPAVKGLKTLITAFAAKVREMIEKQGVGEQIRLEQRKDKLYLVGVRVDGK